MHSLGILINVIWMKLHLSVNCIWSCTRFNIGTFSIQYFFLADLFFILSDIDIATDADDNTSYIAADNNDDLTESLEKASTAFFSMV